jgi:hypothetical protein
MGQKPEKEYSTTLIRSASFWLAVAIPIIAAAAVLIAVSEIGNLELSLSPQALKYTWDNLQPVFWLAGLSIPLGALAAAHHRSVQTAHQLVLQNSQNLFSNYYTHRAEYTKSLESFVTNKKHLIESGLINLLNSEALHRNIYPELRSIGSAEPSLSFSREFEELLREYIVETNNVLVLKDYNKYISLSYTRVNFAAARIFSLMGLRWDGELHGIYIRGDDRNVFDLRNYIGFNKCVTDLLAILIYSYELEGSSFLEPDLERNYLKQLAILADQIDKVQEKKKEIELVVDSVRKLIIATGAGEDKISLQTAYSSAHQPVSLLREKDRDLVVFVLRSPEFAQTKLIDIPSEDADFVDIAEKLQGRNES